MGGSETGQETARDPLTGLPVMDEARARLRDWLESGGWNVEGIVESPITGPQGNVEFLVSATRT